MNQPVEGDIHDEGSQKAEHEWQIQRHWFDHTFPKRDPKEHKRVVKEAFHEHHPDHDSKREATREFEQRDNDGT